MEAKNLPRSVSWPMLFTNTFYYLQATQNPENGAAEMWSGVYKNSVPWYNPALVADFMVWVQFYYIPPTILQGNQESRRLTLNLRQVDSNLFCYELWASLLWDIVICEEDKLREHWISTEIYCPHSEYINTLGDQFYMFEHLKMWYCHVSLCFHGDHSFCSLGFKNSHPS